MPWRIREQTGTGCSEVWSKGDLKSVFREALPEKVPSWGRFVGVREQSCAFVGGSAGRCQGYPRSAWRPEGPEPGGSRGPSQRGVPLEVGAWVFTLSRVLS